MGTEQKQQSDSQDQQQSGAGDQQQRDSGDEQRRDSGDEQRRDSGDEQQRDSGDEQRSESGQLTEKPEVTDEAKEKAKEMAKSYNDDLQTTTLPGSGGTVAGTAVTDWVDEEDKGKIETSAEEGKVEYRNTEEFKKIQES
jgi:hypothetical protein